MTSEKNGPAHEERESTPNSAGPEGAAGGMGSSSERVGHVGPGQEGTDGLRDTSLVDDPADPSEDSSDDSSDDSPDDSPARGKTGPEGIAPKAGYPSLDPRSDTKPFQP